MADGVVVLKGIGIVRLVIIGQHNALEPLYRLVAVSFRDQHTNRSASLGCEPLIVEFIAEDYRIFSRRVFQHTADGQRTLESLFWVVVVVAVIKDTPDISSWITVSYTHLTLPTTPYV